MNYFATVTVKRPFQLPKEQYIALFNPPGVMYVYDSENDFYKGKCPNYAVKTSTMLVGAVFNTHDERWAFELPIGGLRCLGLRSSDEALMHDMWKHLHEFQFIRYDTVDEIVQVSRPKQQNSGVLPKTAPSVDSIVTEMQKVGTTQSAEP